MKKKKQKEKRETEQHEMEQIKSIALLILSSMIYYSGRLKMLIWKININKKIGEEDKEIMWSDHKKEE